MTGWYQPFPPKKKDADGLHRSVKTGRGTRGRLLAVITSLGIGVCILSFLTYSYFYKNGPSTTTSSLTTSSPITMPVDAINFDIYRVKLELVLSRLKNDPVKEDTGWAISSFRRNGESGDSSGRKTHYMINAKLFLKRDELDVYLVKSASFEMRYCYHSSGLINDMIEFDETYGIKTDRERDLLPRAVLKRHEAMPRTAPASA